jgi:hypothetical protein
MSTLEIGGKIKPEETKPEREKTVSVSKQSTNQPTMGARFYFS